MRVALMVVRVRGVPLCLAVAPGREYAGASGRLLPALGAGERPYSNCLIQMSLIYPIRALGLVPHHFKTVLGSH